MKKHLLILLAVLLFAGLYQDAKAQDDSMFYLDGQGRQMKKKDAALDDVEGSIYLADNWAIGTMIGADGVAYKNTKLKYNVLNDQLIYAGPNDELMALYKPAKSFTLNDVLFANGFPPVNDFTGDSYYQVIANGNTKLLKHYSKRIHDSKTYGSENIHRQFVDKQTWYLFKNGKMTEINQDKKSILAALNDKSTELNSYLTTHKVNFKNEADLSMLLAYYNTL